MKHSPEAAERLLAEVETGRLDLDDEMGETDCPEGCYVEPDGYCSHGFESAAISAGII